MNVYDSERMADVLAPLGYAMTDTPEGADLVVLNTCHIREKATEKVYSELGSLPQAESVSAEAPIRKRRRWIICCPLWGHIPCAGRRTIAWSACG